MKTITRLMMLLVLVGTLATSCKKDEEAPDYTVAFKVNPETPLAGEEVTFTQSSTGGKDFVWTIEGETKNGATVKHTFDVEGTYDVTLEVDGWKELTYTKPVNVGAQVPTYTASVANIEMYTDVKFTADVYNPTGATVAYKWTFKAADIVVAGKQQGDDNVVLEGQEVDVMFSHDGDIEFTLEATIDSDTFSGTFQQTVVKQLAKTLYWAEKEGNLWSSKLYSSEVPEAIDMDIESGAHPLTIRFANERLYVFDAGSTITFSADPQEEIGSIKSYSRDGSSYIAHIPEFGGHVYGDAYFGYVDSEYIYFTDRNNDVTRIGVNDENIEWVTASGTVNPENVPALVSNSQLGYYSAWNPDSPSYGWGALNGAFEKRGDVYYWAKNSNHKGLWRFRDADIGVTDVVPTDGGILTDFTVRAFAIDDANSTIYFSVNKTGIDGIGFYKSDLEGNNVVMLDASPVDGEGGGNEYTFITGIVVDNESGYVYWAYRGPTEIDEEPVDYEVNPLYESGIKKLKLDGTGEVEYFVKGVEAYGLTLDNAKL